MHTSKTNFNCDLFTKCQKAVIQLIRAYIESIDNSHTPANITRRVCANPMACPSPNTGWGVRGYADVQQRSNDNFVVIRKNLGDRLLSGLEFKQFFFF